jgi:hypothetical protein
MKKNGWKIAKIIAPNRESGKPVPIVADAAVATVIFGEGRLIPLLILNTLNRPDIENMIKAQVQLPAGEVKSQWARLFSETESTVSLILEFLRPSEIFVLLCFDIANQGILIETILKSKALYLQAGRPGDRLSTTMNTPRMLIEVPDMGFQKEWEKIWPKEVAKKLRGQGLKRKEAKLAADTIIQEMQKVSKFRMRHS